MVCRQHALCGYFEAQRCKQPMMELAPRVGATGVRQIDKEGVRTLFKFKVRTIACAHTNHALVPVVQHGAAGLPAL